ncbi:MAG: flagellar hook protein FlgE [Candidatus Azotimanducaceae bacterium]|jgi:flagellar hook protein FlgE
MPFNTALSGLKAASSDLRITGNNISNASTVGFKESRGEFADVYSANILGTGSKTIGSGVKLEEVAQQFEQGTISFTSNSLDVAIDGEGFFILEDEGASTYTRAGLFGLDQDGFIVANSGARLQGFTANDSGSINGILDDIFIQTGNLSPQPTAQVSSRINLDAESTVRAEFGTTIATLGQQIGSAQSGVAADTPSVVNTTGAPAPFDFSVNSNSSITGSAPVTPFDFGINTPSAVTGTQAITGYDFSLNTASALAATSAPVNFNFSNKPSAVTASAATAAFDFSAPNASATFDVTIAGGSGGNGNTTATITLSSNITSIADLLADINDDLVGIDAVAVENPPGSGALEIQAAVAGEASTITVDGFIAGGAAVTLADISSALGGLTDGQASSGATFDVAVVGGSSDGTTTINLTANVTTFQGLVADIQDQLSVSGIAVDVRQDPSNSGRLQFFSTDDGVATAMTVDNFVAGTADTTSTNITDLLGITDGATNVVPGAGAVGTTGSLTAANFDVTIASGSGAGGNRTVTLTLNQNIANGDLDSLVDDLNTQLAAVASPGIDVRVREDPQNAALLQFYAVVAGETSTVSVDNFQVSGVAGDEMTNTTDILGMLGGITEGDTDASGANTAASFQVRLSGGANGSANQTQTITLDSNINTLQDLITDIRDDLQNTGIGIDVREDPSNIGQLQFFSTVAGEASSIDVDPNIALSLGNGVTQLNVENALGRISMGASSGTPDPSGLTGVTGSVGNLTSATFDVTLSGAGANNVGPVTVTLDTNIATLDELIEDIQDELRLTNIGIDVREDPENIGQLQFFATTAGEDSTITINNFDSSNGGVTAANLSAVLNISTGVTIPGIAAVDNGYAPQSVEVVNSRGDATVTTTVSTLEGESAAQIAARFNDVTGVSASATTTAILPAADYVNNTGALNVSVNGVNFSSASLDDLASDINSSTFLGGISAEIDTATGDLSVVSALGADLIFAVSGTDVTDSISVQGPAGNSVTLDLAGGDSAASVGGSVNFILDENVAFANSTPELTGIFGALEADDFTEFTINSFDPSNQDTYNSATSVTVFDSLGNPHVMTQFFVKEPYREDEVGSQTNNWTMYVQIDGENVGDPDSTLAPPSNTLATIAGFTMQFNEAGQLVEAESDVVHITNWTPVDAEGAPTGALGPQNILEGAVLPVADPAVSSNFLVDMGDSSQFGSVFSVNSVDQDGFSTGRLSGLDISATGLIFARYTNGETQTLGQVGLANFANTQGLNSLGGSSWAESFESGEPVVGTPRSASLGALNAGALEDSNVDLSAELVQLIIAQRNFQASAKTIQTIDAVTQTIINLR